MLHLLSKQQLLDKDARSIISTVTVLHGTWTKSVPRTILATYARSFFLVTLLAK